MSNPAAPALPAAETTATTAAAGVGATPAAAGPPSLLLPKAVSARYVRNLIDKGVAIRRLRIRYVEDLEEVRSKKAEWVAHYTDVLRQLFSTGAVADACNDWVGRVYPEYAETSLFVEQFYQEMDHRCRRLRGVLKQIGEMSDPVITVKSSDASGATPDGADAPASSPIDGSPTAAPFPPAAAAAEPLSPPAAVSGILVTPCASDGTDVSRAGAAVGRFLEDLGVSLITVSSTGPAAKNTEVYEQGPDASFALLLLSPEEAAALRPAGEGQPAAVCRADAAFQLGYFVGRLGVKHVVALVPGSFEPFTGSHGLSCLPLDASNGWQLQLARHLRRAGIDIDLNRLC
jgi:hypothetical protein